MVYGSQLSRSELMSLSLSGVEHPGDLARCFDPTRPDCHRAGRDVDSGDDQLPLSERYSDEEWPGSN
jgi:hypothetical protein